MKKLLLVVGLVGFSLANIQADRLVDAINAHNVGRTRDLLAQYEYLGHAYKNELAHVAHKATKQAKKATASLATSNPDALRLICGLGFSLAGVSLIRNGGNQLGRGKVLVGITKLVSGGLLTLYATKEAYKGWKLTSAHNCLERARDIELLIAQKETKRSDEQNS